MTAGFGMFRIMTLFWQYIFWRIPNRHIYHKQNKKKGRLLNQMSFDD